MAIFLQILMIFYAYISNAFVLNDIYIGFSRNQ